METAKENQLVIGKNNTAARYLPSFGGWLAFKNGNSIKDKHRWRKVFKTSEEALTAAEKSKAVWGW